MGRYQLICAGCGQPFGAKGPQARRCDPCREVHNRAEAARHQAAKRARLAVVRAGRPQGGGAARKPYEFKNRREAWAGDWDR